MPEELQFPRVIYRGHPDTLGLGPHAHKDTGELVGETKRVDSQDALDDALKAGWRLTRELPADPAAPGVDADASADAHGSAKKKKQ